MSMMAEIRSARTTIDSIWDGRDVMLSDELYHALRAQIGTLRLTNSKNAKVIHISTKNCTNSSWWVGSSEYANLGKEKGGASVIISQQLAEALALQPGAEVEVANILTSEESALWVCGQDRTNRFGSGWKVHSYTATAFFAGCKTTEYGEQYPGIYLDTMQLENLNLKASLLPLCGLQKFSAIKEHSPQLAGIVRIFHNSQVIEAAVYPTTHSCYPPAAIMINLSLQQQLQGLQIGDRLRICSRFDVKDYEAAENLQSEPDIEQAFLNQPNPDWLQLLLNEPSIQDQFANQFRGVAHDKLFPILKDFIRDEKAAAGNPLMLLKAINFTNGLDSKIADTLEYKLLLSSMLRDLTENAKILASNPLILLNTINFIDRLDREITETMEYQHLLQAVSREDAIMKEHQDQFLELLTQELLKEDPTHHFNPAFLDALFKMGNDLKNSAGENCLHLMYRLDRGSCSESSSCDGYKSSPAFQRWMREKTPEGKTPLHYLCRQGGWMELLLIGKEISQFNLDAFEDPQGNPFHDLAEDLLEKFALKYTTLMQIVEHLGMGCMKWFDQVDSNGHTPLMKMKVNGIEGLTRFLSCLIPNEDEDDVLGDSELKKTIFTQLISRLQGVVGD